jgi:hypothetical protein
LEVENFSPHQHFSVDVLEKFFLDKKPERANKILKYADFAHKVKVR